MQIIGLSPSGKATDSDSVIRRFESFQPRESEAFRGFPESLFRFRAEKKTGEGYPSAGLDLEGLGMEKKFQVFVSSTYADLIEERREVINGILEAGCFPASMELLSASDRSPWYQIEKCISESDYIILISAGRYGSLTKDEYGDNIGYIEMEYNYAAKIGKPILAFIHKNPDNPKSNPDGTPNKSFIEEPGSKKRRWLLNFHRKIRTDRTIIYWTDKDELKLQVCRELRSAIESETDENKGWVLSNSVSPRIFDVNENLYNLEKEKFVRFEKYNEPISKLEKEKNELIKKYEDEVQSLEEKIRVYREQRSKLTPEEAQIKSSKIGTKGQTKAARISGEFSVKVAQISADAAIKTTQILADSNKKSSKYAAWAAIIGSILTLVGVIVGLIVGVVFNKIPDCSRSASPPPITSAASPTVTPAPMP